MQTNPTVTIFMIGAENGSMNTEMGFSSFEVMMLLRSCDGSAIIVILLMKRKRYVWIPPNHRSIADDRRIAILWFNGSFALIPSLGILSIPSNSISSQKAHDLSSIVQRVTNAGRSEGSDGKVHHWVEIISWEPRAVIYHNFLSKEECEYLINIAKPHMEKSTVVDSVTGRSKDSRVRTSSGTFLERGQDEIVRAIEKRIADFTFLPVEHGEGLQVLHYEVGQKYEPHYDYFLDDYNTKNGGQRMATVLMYLSDVEEGGETVFPSATGSISDVPWWGELSECGKEGLSVKPKMGDALLFWSMKPDATPDPSSLHGGCPVIKGNKWSSTKWIRVNEYKA